MCFPCNKNLGLGVSKTRKTLACGGHKRTAKSYLEKGEGVEW